MSDVRSKLRSLARSPLAWILLGVLALHGVGIGWGLPADDAWDNDGVAPRDFLVGVVQTFTPGSFYTYPPLHVLILAVLTSPVWLLALLRAPSLDPAVLTHAFLTVPTMTAFAYIARAVSVLMSAGIVYALARIGEEIEDHAAGIAVALVAACNAPFTYYAHTTNLEVPYCFWACFAALSFVRAIVRHEPERLSSAAVLAACSMASKDQAAALFLLGAPLGIATWLASDPWARTNVRAVARQLVRATALAAALVLVADNLLLNPSGFLARLRFLFGSASQDHASYAATFAGRLSVLRQTALMFPHFYPWPVAALAALGLFAALRSRPPERRAAACVPAFLGLSFLILFNCLARRTDDRFLLPQSLFGSVYAGLGIHLLWNIPRGKAIARIAVAGILGCALFESAAVDANFLFDPRYAAENWLDAHVRPGDLLEVYGNQIYLPRLPRWARVERVDRRPVDKRNPLIGATEIDAPFEDVEARKPRWIVITDTQVSSYLVNPDDVAAAGRILTPGQWAAQRDEASRAYFRDLFTGRRGYAIDRIFTWTSTFWPRVRFHECIGEEIRVLEREPRP